MKERLIQFINSEGLRPAKFAEIMEIGASGVSHILSGRNKPNYDFMVKLLSKFPTLNPDWLILGQGEMYRNINHNSIPAQMKDPQNSSTVSNQAQQIELFSSKMLNSDNSEKDSAPDQAYSMNEIKPETDIEKVIIIYSDGTFSNYKPSK